MILKRVWYPAWFCCFWHSTDQERIFNTPQRTASLWQRCSRGFETSSWWSSRWQWRDSTGQSKERKFWKVRDEWELCWKVGNSTSCEFGEEYVFYISLQLLRLIQFNIGADSLTTILPIPSPNHQISTFLPSIKFLESPHLHRSLRKSHQLFHKKFIECTEELTHLHHEHGEKHRHSTIDAILVFLRNAF